MPRHHRIESKNSPRRLEALKKQEQALELMLAGADYGQIALTLGYASRSGAYQAVKAARAAVLAPGVEELRRRNMERINRMRQANWPKARGGDPKGVDIELRLQEREARYLGLDKQPTDEGARAVAVAAVKVVIQVGEREVDLGDWRRAMLASGDGKGDGQGEG